MGLIFDNNRTALLSQNPAPRELSILFRWVKSSGCLVVGGKLKEELSGNVKMLRLMAEFKRSGKLKDVSGDDLNRVLSQLFSSNTVTSNDHHILAVALISGARLLFTEDQALIDDFKNPNLINSPRGVVYKRSPNHDHLLNRVPTECCRLPSATLDATPADAAR